MKRIFALFIALAFSLPAHAVDLTISMTAPQAARIAAACGKRMGLVDAQVDPKPRSCDMAEAKAWTIKLWREAVTDSEQEDANKARSLTPFDPS